MIDGNKPLYNSFGQLSLVVAKHAGTKVSMPLGNGDDLEYWTHHSGRAPKELGEKFDVFNKLSQKEKALCELTKYNDAILHRQRQMGFSVNDDSFEVKFPEIAKLLTED